MTLTNNHSLTVSQLSPGVVTVTEGGEKKDYFVSDGYVFYNHATDGSGYFDPPIMFKTMRGQSIKKW